MKIIMLIGSTNCGKTTTINLVYYQLKSEEGVKNTRERERTGGNPDDFEAELDYHGKKVAFHSMGDYVNPVKKAINTCPADVLICTCNDYKLSSIQPIVEQLPHHIIIKKGKDNNEDATKIIQELTI
jgi:hypothetical protein